jgi:hypothetical protein
MSWVDRARERLTFPVNAAAIGAILGGVVGGVLAAGPVPLDTSAGTGIGGVIGSALAAATAWFVDRPTTAPQEWDRHLRARMRLLWVSGPRAPLSVTRSAGGVLRRLPTHSWKLLQSSPVASVVGRIRRWLPLPQGLSPGDLFDRFDGSMLIVGDPGAGKSVLLWEILEALLDRDRDTLDGTPVLIELHRWEVYDSAGAYAQPSFEGFIRRELAASPNNVPADATRLLLDDLVLLLDGLDELSDDLAIRCLEALRDFVLAGPSARRRRRIVMTCRDEDYERIAARWDTPNTIVTHAVRLLPLPDRDVRRALEHANPNGRRLIAAAERVPELGRMLRTPLWLSVASRVYRYTPGPDPLAGLDAEAEQPAVERALYEHWLALQMRWRSPAFQRRVGFLAERMRVNGQQTIYLESVQPRWLPRSANTRWPVAFAYALVTLVGIWLLMGLAAAYQGVTSEGGWIGGVGGWLGSARTVGVPAALTAAVVYATPHPAGPPRPRSVLDGLREAGTVALAVAALVGALYLMGFTVHFYWFEFNALFVWSVIRTSTTGSESPRPLVATARRLLPRRALARRNLATGLLLGLAVAAFYVVGVRLIDPAVGVVTVVGLIVGLAATSAFLVHGAMVPVPADRGRSLRPLGALWRSGRTGLMTGLIVVPAVVATFALLVIAIVVFEVFTGDAGGQPLRRLIAIAAIFTDAVVVTVTIWAPIAVLTALEGGIGAVVEHVTARLIAARRGWLPLRLATLLDRATRDGILYPVGPGWRFRHRTLAEQLAADYRAAHAGDTDAVPLAPVTRAPPAGAV